MAWKKLLTWWNMEVCMQVGSLKTQGTSFQEKRHASQGNTYSFFIFKRQGFSGWKLSTFAQSCKRTLVSLPASMSYSSHHKVCKLTHSLFNWSAAKCLTLPNNTDSSCFHVDNFLPRLSSSSSCHRTKCNVKRQTSSSTLQDRSQKDLSH